MIAPKICLSPRTRSSRRAPVRAGQWQRRAERQQRQHTDPRVTGLGVRSVSPDFQKQQAGRKPPSINYSFGAQCSESNEVKILMCSMLPDHLQSDPSTNLMCCDERMPSTRFVARSYSLRPSPKVGRFRSLRRELRRGRKVEGALKTPDRHRFVLGG
jgi:hypothetical protein